MQANQSNKIEKPWSVDQFELFRPYMCTFVREQVVPLLNQHELRRLLIHGQVKVGKREIVEYITVRDSYNQHRIHVFVSSFHRKADASQRDELELHGIEVFSIHNARRKQIAIEFISEQLESSQMSVVIHWDECDYGTGIRQNLADVFRLFRDHPRVFNILYSATPEEMLYSSEIAVAGDDNSFISDFYEEGTVLRYTPPPGYCGAQRFLNEHLVHQAIPFFEATGSGITLSEQAKTILTEAKSAMRVVNRRRRDLKNQMEDAEDDGDASRVESIKHELSQICVRNIIALRLSYFLGDDDDDEEDITGSDVMSVAESESARGKAIYTFLIKSQFVDELKDVIIIADKQDVKELSTLPNVSTATVEWSQKKWWDRQPEDKILLIVNDQTSTRSTEWACHNRMFATHDYRKRLTFNTVLQAQLRPAHYEQNYGGFQPIRIYGDVKTFQFAIGQINAAEYLNSTWRIRKIPKTNPARFRLKHENDTRSQRMEMPVVSIVVGGVSTVYQGVPDNNGYTADVAQKILVELGGTNNGHSKMSQRVRGNSKQTPVIHSKFYPCNPNEVRRILADIKADEEAVCGSIVGNRGTFPISRYLEHHNFSESTLFARRTDEGQYMGYLRGFKVLEYDRLKTEMWGIRVGHETTRLTVCYNAGVVGLCLRFATGIMVEVSDLEAYKSMYQGRE